MKPLRVAINAQIPSDGSAGGIQQNLIGLLRALGDLNGPEEYLVIGLPGDSDWLLPYLSPTENLVHLASPVRAAVAHLRGGLRRGDALPLRELAEAIAARTLRLLGSNARRLLPRSYGRIESLSVEVVHFPEQSYIDSSLPSIYVPHDLQHVHLPEFFTPKERDRREAMYRAACDRASVIVVEAEWVKADFARHYGLPREKIQVIPTAAPVAAYQDVEDVDGTLRRFGIDWPYILYPAVTWPHKNHLRLLEALAQIRDVNGLTLHLVCTGAKFAPHWPAIEASVATHGLRRQVSFLGFVPPVDLRALYQRALFLVLPTLFESVSGPIFEAWYEGTAVACSAVTALPEQVGDAALLFDPLNVDSIADAIRRIATDDSLRRDLLERGQRRIRDFSWNRTARAYRALYRKLAGWPLDDSEQQLLRWNWMTSREMAPCV